jgi:hypothetical protein
VLHVNLNDSIAESIKSKSGGKGLSILIQGKLVEKDDTFAKLHITPSDLIFSV